MTTENQAPEGEPALTKDALQRIVSSYVDSPMLVDELWHSLSRAALAAQPQSAAPSCPHTGQCHPGFCPCSDARRAGAAASAEGDAEDLRIALARRDIAIEGRDRGAAKVKAMRAALDFAAGAIGDAIYTEDGLDGDAGQRVLHIITEARELGTFDQQQFGALDHLCPFARAEKAEAALSAHQPKGASYSTTDGVRCDHCRLTLSAHGDGGRTCPAPSPAVKDEPAPNDWRLPADLKAAHVTFRKGVHCSALVSRMKMLHEAAFGVDSLTPKQKAENLAALQARKRPPHELPSPPHAATLTISVEGSSTTIDCDWGDVVRALPPGTYPLYLSRVPVQPQGEQP